MENQEEKQNKRRAIVLLVVAILVVVGMIAGATYAYFQAQQGKGQSSDVNVTTGTTDNLNFNITDLDVTRTDIVDEDNVEVPININANMNNFTENDTSLGDGVTATATLIANDATNEAKENYYVYLNITKNELKYSSYKRNELLEPDPNNENTLVFKTEEEKKDAVLTDYSPIPELYLTIKKNGSEITSGVKINGKELTHVTEILVDPDNEVDQDRKTLGGFDITEVKGLITIEDEQSMEQTIKVEKGTENNTTVDTWEIIITYVNLETDQNLNTKKELTGQVLIQKEEKVLTFDELCMNQELGNCIKDNYKTDATIYYHNTELVGGAGDESYRYSGPDASVNNYVCLDGITLTGECANQDADLYRIIGSFKNTDSGQYEIKLIKYDYVTSTELGDAGAFAGKYTDNDNVSNMYKGKSSIENIAGYYWAKDNIGNNWDKSELNSQNLNEEYLNYLKNTKNLDTDKLITVHKWKTIGYNNAYVAPKTFFDYEMGKIKQEPTSPATSEEASAQIGLMYISDYGYAISPESTSNWTTEIGNYSDIIENNWLYMGLTEWSITRSPENNTQAMYLYADGSVFSERVYESVSSNYAIRPVFYLNSKAKIINGKGTKDNPYRIAIN